MTRLLFHFGIVLLLALALPILRADNMDAVKARMEQRQPALDALRREGSIGENSRGYTEVRHPSVEHRKSHRPKTRIAK
ncbi:MAG: hypothetical protein LC114_06030 [Bryobacterales bacterium]|nr:hypothetical protein [Bryobacterales bacterium]